MVPAIWQWFRHCQRSTRRWSTHQDPIFSVAADEFFSACFYVSYTNFFRVTFFLFVSHFCLRLGLFGPNGQPVICRERFVCAYVCVLCAVGRARERAGFGYRRITQKKKNCCIRTSARRTGITNTRGDVGNGCDRSLWYFCCRTPFLCVCFSAIVIISAARTPLPNWSEIPTQIIK